MSAVLGVEEQRLNYRAAPQAALVQAFDQVAQAPVGVARLRELILSLAVRGKLSSPKPTDDPVTVLLQQTAIAKSAGARGRKGAEIPEIVVGAFDIPDTWAWVAFGAVAQVSGGVTLGRKTAIKQPLTLPYLRVANVQRWRVFCDDLKAVTISATELPRYQLQRGDLLITEGGDWDKVGRTAVWRDEIDVCLHQNHVFKARGVTPDWNPAWAELYLNSPDARTYFASCSKQTTNLASINMTQLKACAFPLPPAAEQARIVARVDELMRLCDALEAKGRLEAEQHARLLSTLLGTLTDSTTPEELATNWQRVATHFDLLLDRPEAVDALEQTILQLAVRGLLVPQDPSEEAAHLLLKRLREEKARNQASRGRMQNNAETETGPTQHEPYPAPPGWVWATLASIGLINPRNEAGDSTMVSFVQMSSIPTGFLDVHDTEPRPWKDIKSGFTQFAEGDVGVAKITPCFENGKSTVFQNLTNGIGAGTTELHIVRPLCGIEPRYVLIFLKSPRFLRGGEDVMTGTAGQKRLPRSYFENCPFPLPPLPEQARIVTRVTELRRLCTDLRQRLSAQQAVQSQLADALVEQALT